MNFGEKLQLLRRSRGLSQEQLAEVLEVSRQAISKWENNDSEPDLEKLRAICTYFGVTTDYLIWENAEDAPQGSAASQKTTDHAARREGLRETVRKNAHWHWVGYLLAIVGGALLVRFLLSLISMSLLVGNASEMLGTMVRLMLPYLCIYAAMLVGGLLLARWLKKRSREREAHDDL